MPTPPRKGLIVAPSLNHGATGLYTCKVGVQLQCCGVVVLWCCGVSTPAAQNINYCSSINLCPGHHLTICHACCQDGFELRGEEKTSCVYGNWTGLTPSCQEQYCSFPGYLDNGKVGGAAALLL